MKFRLIKKGKFMKDKTHVIRVSENTYRTLEQISKSSNKRITEVADILIAKGKKSCKVEKQTIDVLILD